MEEASAENTRLRLDGGANLRQAPTHVHVHIGPCADMCLLGRVARAMTMQLYIVPVYARATMRSKQALLLQLFKSHMLGRDVGAITTSGIVYRPWICAPKLYELS